MTDEIIDIEYNTRLDPQRPCFVDELTEGNNLQHKVTNQFDAVLNNKTYSALLCSSDHFKSCVSDILFWFMKCTKLKNFCLIFGVNTSKQPKNHCIMCKVNTWACRGIPQGNILSGYLVYGKRKSGVFFAGLVRSKQAIWNFHSTGMYVITLHHNNLQVTIFVKCLNFAGTRSWILLPTVSLSRRVIPSLKIAFNSNGEISYQELPRRPWIEQEFGV